MFGSCCIWSRHGRAGLARLWTPKRLSAYQPHTASCPAANVIHDTNRTRLYITILLCILTSLHPYDTYDAPDTTNRRDRTGSRGTRSCEFHIREAINET